MRIPKTRDKQPLLSWEEAARRVRAYPKLVAALKTASEELECNCGVTQSGNRCEGACALAKVNSVLTTAAKESRQC